MIEGHRNGGPLDMGSSDRPGYAYIESVARLELPEYDLSEKALSAPVRCWLDCCRLRHHFQASMPTPAIAALRILLPPKVSLRTCRLSLFPNPNIRYLLAGAANGDAP